MKSPAHSQAVNEGQRKDYSPGQPDSRMHIHLQCLTAFKEEPQVCGSLSNREDSDNRTELKSETRRDIKAPHQDFWDWKSL